MRVNVDDQALAEPKIRRMARRLGVTHYEVLGRLVHVWMVCYQRRACTMDAIDIDIAADRDGFAEAMRAEGMAEVEDGGLYVRGVSERIRFLDKQAEKGRKSGESRRAKADAKRWQEPRANQNRTAVQQRFPSGSTTPRTYSQAPDQALAPDQAPDQTGRSATREPASDPAASGPTTAAEPGTTPPAPIATGAGPQLFPVGSAQGMPESSPRPSQTPPPPSQKPRPEPRPVPEQCHTLATLLLETVELNHPSSRIAKAPDRIKAETAARWATTVDKLHRIDGRTYAEIEAMIVWCQSDQFWRGVILGADNLRDKWDTMEAQKRRRVGSPAQARSVFDVLDEAAAAADQRAAAAAGRSNGA